MKPVLSAVKTQKLIVDRTKNATNQFQVVTSDEQRGGSMERRDLAATLALAATFAIFSGEFRTRFISKIPHTPAQVKDDVASARLYVAQRVGPRLQPYLDRDAQRQLGLAQLGVPLLPPAPAALLAP